MATIAVVGNSAGDLTTKVTALLDTDVQPIGDVILTGNQSEASRKFIQVMGENTSAITEYRVIHARSLDDLLTAIDDIDSDEKLYGNAQVLGDLSGTLRSYAQAVVVGTLAGGGGSSVTLPPVGTAAELTAGTVTDSRLWSPKVLKDAQAVLPAAGTAAEISAGTVTANRIWSPKIIHDEIARQITATSGA
jgi:hypothetical protein